jgi:hypothetical protein
MSPAISPPLLAAFERHARTSWIPITILLVLVLPLDRLAEGHCDLLDGKLQEASSKTLNSEFFLQMI